MKKGLTIFVAAAALAATLPSVAANSLKYDPTTDVEVLPAYQILVNLRLTGLSPIGEPARRGPYYFLHAYDLRGIEMRVVADAHLGDILSVEPARTLYAIALSYAREPRIIHVPQPDDDKDRSSNEGGNQPAASVDADGNAIVPLPRRRAVSSTPSLVDGPTPIRQIPQSKAGRRNKVDAPGDPTTTSSTPSSGDGPPVAFPHSN